MARAFIAAACLWAAACGNQAQLVTETAANFVVEDTTLGVGDVFDVRVYGQESLTGRYKVASDGTIQYPFLGAVPAGGKEPEDVAALIASGLKSGGFLQDPHVSVMVAETNSRRLSVIGAVAKPGTFAVIPGMTVIQAISQAGGFSPMANKDGTVVTRKVDGKLTRFRVPVSDISRGAAPDVPLRASDIVFVPERVF